MSDSQDRCQVGTLAFEVATLDDAVNRTIDEALRRRSDHIHLANAWSIALAEDDSQLRDAFGTGSNYPDGKPVVWVMRWRHRRSNGIKPARVDGPTFFERVLEQGVPQNVKHFFFGSTPETLEKLQDNVRIRFPGIDIVGVSSPPFKDLTAEDLAGELARIRACEPHLVWVGLGTPKQDKVAAYLAEHYSGIFACVGAAFDYTAGNLRETPKWIQEAGLGWLFRLAQEPRRLWRRYLFGNARFIRIVAKQIATEQRTLRAGKLT